MMHTLLYSEMNQAVPGVSLSPGHEGGGYGECQVPSPSQWSDPCYSPPSFHSPQHLPGELDKVKEEPFSPPPSTTYVSLPPSPPTSHLSLSPQAQHHVSMSPPGPMHVSGSGPSPHHVSPYARPPSAPKKDGFEASINITELLAENQALSSSLSPTSYGSYPDHPLLRGRLEDNAQKKIGFTCPSSDNLSFLDTLVDVKQEVEEEVSVGSSCGSPAAPSPGCASQKEILETVELALEHARRDVHRVSDSLNIPRDPAHWSVEDVRKWLKLQAAQLNLPPLMLDFWNLAGPALLKLTEAQFRQLAPVGGELLYAQLEIWREALRTAPKLPHTYYWHLQADPQAAMPIQPIHPQPQPQPQQQQQQPQAPPQQQCQPQVSPSPQMGSPRSSPLGLAPSLSQVPTPVAQVAQQQQQQQSPAPLQPAPVGAPQQASAAPPAQQQASAGPVYLDEPCLDMAALLQQQSGSPKAAHAAPVPAHSPQDDAYDSEDDADEETTTNNNGRGGTHIHLWQFLKELLHQPQLYGSCIRWLDRPKGVFKIEDSVRVARLWGKRKNRPAMNYDKLSRSIRQYYKKGIMKKTERSQRLVYQFCHPYCL